MAANKISDIRRAVSRLRNSGGRIRYSTFVRGEVLKLLRRGQSVTALADETGIGVPTLMRWSSEIEPGFRSLKVSKSPKPPEVSVVATFSDGLHLEAASVAQLISVLERLR